MILLLISSLPLLVTYLSSILLLPFFLSLSYYILDFTCVYKYSLEDRFDHGFNDGFPISEVEKRLSTAHTSFSRCVPMSVFLPLPLTPLFLILGCVSIFVHMCAFVFLSRFLCCVIDFLCVYFCICICVYASGYLGICFSLYVSVYLSVHLSVCLSVCVSACLPFCMCSK